MPLNFPQNSKKQVDYYPQLIVEELRLKVKKLAQGLRAHERWNWHSNPLCSTLNPNFFLTQIFNHLVRQPEAGPPWMQAAFCVEDHLALPTVSLVRAWWSRRKGGGYSVGLKDGGKDAGNGSVVPLLVVSLPTVSVNCSRNADDSPPDESSEGQG